MNTERKETDRNFDIVAGPNRDLLFDACKYAHDKTARIPVDFTVVIGYTMPKDHPGCAYIPMFVKDITINRIEHEDGSGESFNVWGYCEADLTSIGGVATYVTHYFRAYYNTKNRSGRIRFYK